MPKIKKTNTEKQIFFPASLVAPVRVFLKDQLERLKSNRKKIDESDPFKNESRVEDSVALDTDAEEQFGHAMTGALKDQLDRRIIQTRKALTRIKIGKYGICEVCGSMIDTDRLMAYPEATKCINCERKSHRK
ncbi:MAG: Transcriptional regulator, TraR/DksA family [Candidatus Woesebacteria bacterium GW2011_GWB1_38_5b]|uniref:Transcriptional regulator, TraR/DksA family n=1 Tax=Candidatus Woesebacteria bacterium GW2011_GWB1_38_5b TaxID=1618569 RepID=A0A0G0K859_9BACT|nr:MAG: Transcriptional regulator, TraR/DksA family [Candidatus Woesebacteria bacterium GW2011_GWB1_38_5b]